MSEANNKMKATVGIVPEVLTSDNFEKWKVYMKNYLMGEGLWDVVIGRGSWGVVTGCHELQHLEQGLVLTRNAKVMHIIQMSCGRQIQNELLHFQTAREVWNYLNYRYGRITTAKLDGFLKAELGDNLNQQQKELFRKVERGDYIGNMIRSSTDVVMTSDSISSKTLLHVAVITGHVKNVEILVEKGGDMLLEMRDNQGDTALALVARYTGNIDMAKCMVETKQGSRESLLVLPNRRSEIPVILAAAKGYKEMTRYLYSKTPVTALDYSSQSRLKLLDGCITAHIFDVALSLLKRYPDLFIEAWSEQLEFPDDSFTFICKFSDALSKMASSFPSGSGFRLPEKLIYHFLRVEKEFEVKYGIPDTAKFVRSVTPGVDRSLSLHKTSAKCCFSSRVLNFLLVPLNLLGRLLREFPYLLVQVFKYLNIFGTRRIYDKKYTHYEVIFILRYFCQSIGEFSDRQLSEAFIYEAMLYAARNGIIEFINAMRDVNHNLLLVTDNCDRGIFWYAILNRRREVFQLLYCLNGSQKELIRYRIDTFDNNMLHVAAQLGTSSDRYNRSGAALQMQREIQWFKAVEKVMHPKFREAKNADGKKPYEVFTENHEELVKDGEKWAKDTATSYTIVGTLIITIMFAAAFTVPGGNDQNSGLPIFLHGEGFSTFLIADALSLFASATSVLIFIGILTSRYAEKDFLKSLPWKLLFGLLFLVVSVCCMIVAFCAAIIDMISRGYPNHKWSIIVPTVLLGSIPIIVLVVSQLRLMKEIIHSTWKNPI